MDNQKNLNVFPFNNIEVQFTFRKKSYEFMIIHNMENKDILNFLQEWSESLKIANTIQECEFNINVETFCDFINAKHEDIRAYSVKDWKLINWIARQQSNFTC
jgi:hypothetical protein